MRLVQYLIPALSLLGLLVFVGMKVADPPAAQMQSFADAFLATLDDDQKGVAVVPFDSAKRVEWHFIPMKTRKGLVMREMNTAQKTAALRLVRGAQRSGLRQGQQDHDA